MSFFGVDFSLLSSFSDILYKIGGFTLVIMIIVTIHELGHYMVARLVGCDIEVFSIGLGKKLISFTDKHNTLWQVSALPLGGYVKIKGENGADDLGQESQDNFENKKSWQKCLVVLAGPFFNFMLSFLIIVFLFSFYGKPSVNLAKHDLIINTIQENSLAQRYGILLGEQIISINDKKIDNVLALQKILQENSNKKIFIQIFNPINKDFRKIEINLDQSARLGVSIMQPNSGNLQKMNLLDSIRSAFIYNVELMKLTIQGIIKIFSSKEHAKQIGGLIQIADISGNAIQSGMMSFLFFLALLSINLGIINLFPLPALDGGRFIFYFLDMLWIGRLISPKIRGYAIASSFFLLIGLMIFANLNDIYKIFFNTH